MLALTQIVSKGKVQAEEINQIAERVPQIREAMKAAFGTADTEVLQKQKLSPEKFVAGIVAELEKLPKVTGGVRNDFENLADTVNNALVVIGDALVPFVSQVMGLLVPALERATQWFQALPASMKDGVVIFGLVAAAAGPLIVALGAIVSAAGTIIAALASISAPVVATVAVVVAAAAAISAAYYSNLGGIRDFTNEIFEAVKSAVAAGLVFVRELWARHGAEISQLAQTYFGAVSQIVQSVSTAIVSFWRQNLGTVVTWTRDNWPLIKQTIETVLKATLAVMQAILGQIQAFWTAHGQTITTIARVAWTTVTTIFGTALRNLLSVIKIVMQLINGEWAAAWETFKAALRRTVGAIAGLALEFLRAGEQLADSIVAGIVLGLLNGRARVLDAAKNLALSAIFGAKVQLESQSPSRVFYRIGEDVVTGFVNALRDGYDRAQKAMTDLMRFGPIALKFTPAQRTRAAGIGESETESKASAEEARLRRGLEAARVSEENYVASVITSQEKVLNARLAVIAAQRAEARATITDRADLALRLEELRVEDERLVREHEERARQIRTDSVDRQKEKIDELMSKLRELADMKVDVESPELPSATTRKRYESGPWVDPAGDMEKPPPVPVPDLSVHTQVIGQFKDFAVKSFGGITQGFGGMIQAFLAGGPAAQKSFAAIAKAAAASLAAQAIVAAAMEVAYGLSELAKAAANPLTAAQHAAAAAMHFASAQAFGIVGGIAAAAALVIPGGKSAGNGPGNAVGNTSRSTSSSSSTQSGGPDVIEQSRNTSIDRTHNLRPEPVRVIVELHSRNDPGTFVEMVGTAIQGHGEAIVQTLHREFHLDHPTLLGVLREGSSR